VNLLNNKQVDKFITIKWLPWSLSINSSRLLITTDSGRALFLYKDDGSKLNHIQLPECMKARHAVETTNKTYIVCYRKRLYVESEEVDGVSELDVDGRVVRTFNNQHIDIDSIKFKWPHYLVTDDNNHVIVADLQLKRVLIPTLDGLPWRLCLNKSTGLMFMENLSNIDIYKVKSVE
jgi:hypothetical protein